MSGERWYATRGAGSMAEDDEPSEAAMDKVRERMSVQDQLSEALAEVSRLRAENDQLRDQTDALTAELRSLRGPDH